MGKKTRNAKKSGGILAGHTGSASSSPSRSVTPTLSLEKGKGETKSGSSNGGAAGPIQAVALTPDTKRRMNGTPGGARGAQPKAPSIPPAPPSPLRKFLCGLLRVAVLDTPLLLLFFLSASASLIRTVHERYLEPQMSLMEWNPEEDRDEDRDRDVVEEYTYYARECVSEDVTASDVDELLIDETMTTKEKLDHNMIHGASIYSDILKQDTASAVREFVLRRNAELEEGDGIEVIENDNRWSFGIGATEDPAVVRALREIGSHSVLRPALEAIAGRNPAVIEMTAITSAYGAKDQFWHEDTLPKGNSLRYGRAFVPSYSLFITLQDTSRAMGATEVCPGTHLCGEGGAEDFCPQLGFPASGRKAGKSGKWKAGSAMLMNQQTFHRGRAHTDPEGPDRVLFILTFAPRPQRKGESRMLPQGGSYSTRWDMWGHTLDDMANAPKYMKHPLPALRALGVYKPSTSPEWGWDFVSVASMRISNGDVGYTDEDLEKFVERGGIAGAVYKFMRNELGLPVPWSVGKNFVVVVQRLLESEVNLEEDGWRAYIESTVERMAKLSSLGHGAFLGGYTLLAVLSGLWSFLRGRRNCKGLLGGAAGFILRLAFIHGTVLALNRYALRQVESSNWAEDIEAGRLYSPAFPSPLDDHSLGHAAVLSANAHFPSTVPRRSDALIGARLDSPALASIRNVLDYHPGSVAWAETLDSYDTDGTAALAAPRAIRDAMARSAVDDLTIGGRRLLLQDADTGYWTVPPLEEARKLALRAMILRGNEKLGTVDAAIRRLLDAHRTGDWRETALGGRIGVDNLERWRDMLFVSQETKRDCGQGDGPILGCATKKPMLAVQSGSHVPKPTPFAPLVTASKMTREDSTAVSARCVHNTRGLDLNERRRNVEKAKRELSSRQSFDRWPPQEGDNVEGQYQAEHNEWYKGRVHVARPNGIYDVLYDDGELDPELPRRALRPYKPLVRDEMISVQIDADNEGEDDFWEPGVIRDIIPAGPSKPPIYNVVTREGYFESNVTVTRIRRFSWEFSLDDAVMAKFRGLPESDWFPGVISKVRKDGTYDIEYDDGDIDKRIRREAIRFDWTLAGEGVDLAAQQQQLEDDDNEAGILGVFY